MTVHLDLSIWELLLWCALFFFAAIGVVLVCFCILVDAFRISFPLPATAADTDVVPETPPVPVVHVGEVVLAPRQDLLPPAPVSMADVPIFADVPFTLPMAMDFGFTWGPSALTTPTGSYQVIADPQAQPARARFATSPPAKRKGGKRQVSVKVGADVRSELIEVPS
jgi:hypothetical protein